LPFWVQLISDVSVVKYPQRENHKSVNDQNLIMISERERAESREK